MGFFKDINTLKQQGKEMGKNSDPGRDLRNMTEKMAELNQSMTQATAALAAPPADAVDATAQVVSVSPPSGFMNADSIVPVELLVLQPGLPPRPLSLAVVVPMPQIHRLQAGASLPVKVSASDPSALAIDWTVPA
jgi:hypothetical protein